MSDWLAVVLAGGVGSRLFPLTKERPKPLIEIGNRPMIDYAIQLIKDAGINKIIVAVKYKGDMIRSWIEERQEAGYFGDTEILVPEIDPKDTADAVRELIKLDLIDRNFVVTMADIVTNLDLKAAIDFHQSHSPSPIATICLKPVEQPGQFGLTMLDNDNRIHLFLEKPTPHELMLTTMTFSGKGSTRSLQHNLANIGIYVIDHQMVSILENYGDLMDWGSHVFPFLLDHDYDVRGYLSDPYWVDAGTHKKYIWANNDVIKKWSYPYIPFEKEINEFEFIGENVELGEGTKIIPPVLIGNNCTIGNNCSIGPNVTIGRGVTIGTDTKIQESVIHDTCVISDGADIYRTILSRNVKLMTQERQSKMVFPSNLKLELTDNQYRY
ncbi:MAG: sugar phosphate nucleotidyltransferase [Candidatus Kariarchaeaceae archaeon]|jgi:NDP-sugar pyrophosphorylase family protein